MHRYPCSCHSTEPYRALRIHDALNEADLGQHVAHIMEPKTGRTVAIRPVTRSRWAHEENEEFDLVFSDPELGQDVKAMRLRPISRDKAAQHIENFLEGVRFDNEDEQGEMFINQAERWVEIVAVKWSRLRLEYELPRSGRTGCWRRHTKLGDVLYVNPEPY